VLAEKNLFENGAALTAAAPDTGEARVLVSLKAANGGAPGVISFHPPVWGRGDLRARRDPEKQAVGGPPPPRPALSTTPFLPGRGTGPAAHPRPTAGAGGWAGNFVEEGPVQPHGAVHCEILNAAGPGRVHGAQFPG